MKGTHTEAAPSRTVATAPRSRDRFRKNRPDVRVLPRRLLHVFVLMVGAILIGEPGMAIGAGAEPRSSEDSAMRFWIWGPVARSERPTAPRSRSGIRETDPVRGESSRRDRTPPGPDAGEGRSPLVPPSWTISPTLPPSVIPLLALLVLGFVLTKMAKRLSFLFRDALWLVGKVLVAGTLLVLLGHTLRIAAPDLHQAVVGALRGLLS